MFNKLDRDLIILSRYIETFGCSHIKFISKLLNIDKGLINLKGKTVEKLGIIGKEKAIACEVICSISQ